MEADWWDASLTLRDLAEVTHKPYTNSRHSQISLFLAACVRSKESLSVSPATQDNLEPILLLRSVHQHQKQKDEILESPYVPHPWTFHYVTSLLSQFSHLATSLPSHTFSTVPAHYPPHFPTFPAQYSVNFPSSPPSLRQIDHSKIATFLHQVDRANMCD